MSTLSSLRPSRARAHHSARPGVPWATVATFAVGMSCTSAFWLVSLTGAIGSPDRYERPFATWVMLSIALLPVYGAGVLGAMVLAKHWFGPVVHGWARVLATALLILAGGTLTGVAAIAASGAYDYHFQMHVLHTMGGMNGMAPCTGPCIPREEHQILALHIDGVQLVGQKLLLTNAVLVAWVVAMWGGRIKLTNRSWRNHGPVEEAAPTGTLANDVRLLVVGMVTGAAVIHAAVVPEHLEEWPAAGWFFLVVTLGELVVAGLLLARFHERAALYAAGTLSAVPLMVWLWSRTLGLPFGPESGVAEAVGVPDVIACVLEVGALLAVWALLKPGRLVRPALSAHIKGLVALTLIGVISIGFVATGPSWFDAFGVHATQSSMDMSE